MLLLAVATVLAQEAEIRIVATDYAFEPAAIDVTAGTVLRVVLVNEGASNHNVEFVFPDATHRLEADVPPGAEALLTVPVPSVAGEYTFSCPVDDHEGLGMTGTLRVTE
ncbi:MAG: cupredoxin domain-containing protein [Myxococcota bacterium]